ncbi:MAG: hypothetical protein ACKVT0_02190 [Planctomycetaceae bacterium]
MNTTESSDPDADKPLTGSSDGASHPESTPPSAEVVPDVTTPGTPTTSAEGDLPEWEPLTPELVEDEAIRGDFMLRWAVVLLAFLLSCSEIAETSTLVHIKTGQYLAQHGVLPPRTDVLSYTATDRSWVNLEWFYDLILAGVYGLAGPVGLTLFKALLAGVTFYLVGRTTLPGISTWWGSIMATLALIACYPQISAEPRIVTLLGLALTLFCLQQWRCEKCHRSLYGLIIWFAVWSNLDRRMILGLVLLTLYAAGETLRLKWKSAEAAGDSPTGELSHLWKVVGGSWVASLINPFGWHSWLSLVDMYRKEYPALREHGLASSTLDQMLNHPMWYAGYWTERNPYVIAGIVVVLGGLISWFLNLKNKEWGHLFAMLGMVSCALFGGWELAPAALVCCILGTISSQAWYKESFRQVYSLDTAELLFSRGGRAATVLVLFAIAYLDISGRIVGLNQNRIGFGFSPAFSSMIRGYDAGIDDAFDDRPYHFRIGQGDVLIWLGQKSFVDTRVRLFYGSEQTNLYVEHDAIRRALRQRNKDDSQSGKTDVWKKAFDRYKVTHVLPRLDGPIPDYRSFGDLLGSPHWQLVALRPSTAVFYRRNPADRKLQEYVNNHKWNVIQLAFKTEAESSDSQLPRIDFVKPRSVYERYLTVARREIPNGAQLSMHYLQLLLSQQVMPDVGASISLLAIREAQSGLAENPRSAEAYFRLGMAYSIIGQFESQLAPQQGGQLETIRLYQSLMAYHQAMILEPQNIITLDQMLELYLQSRRFDLALDILNKQTALADQITDLTEEDLDRERRNQQIREQVTNIVDRAAKVVGDELKKGTDRFQIAQSASQQMGCTLEALRILEEDPIYLVNNPAAAMLQVSLLIEAGRLSEAHEQVSALGEKLKGQNSPLLAQIHFLQGIIALGQANYDQASQIWEADIREHAAQRNSGMMNSLPFVSLPAFLANARNVRWPIPQSAAVFDYLFSYAQDVSILRYHAARSYLEAGKPKEATAQFRAILEIDPETPLRRVVAFYLYLLTEEIIEVLPPSEWLPFGPDSFAPEVANEPLSATEKP